MFENESVHELMSLAQDTPYGKTCSALWAEAARRAGAEGLEHEEVWCYLQLASAFTMGGEVTRMVAPFMWVDKRRKERPDLFDQRMLEVFAWYYKYLLLVLRDMPQASAEQCFTALQEMREFYQSLGDSLKAVYLREYYVYFALGLWEDAEEAHRKWKLADVSDLSDCVACDPQHEVTYLSRQKHWEKAVEVGEAALEHAEDSCSAQPENLYTRMLLPWLYMGRDDKAWPAHVRAMQRNSQRSHFLEHLPQHLWYLQLSGSAGRPQRLQRALEMATRFLPWWLEAETPMVLLEMAVATARVFGAQPDQQATLNITLPGESLPWVKAVNVQEPTVGEAYAWCADLACKLATMFDERPGIVERYMLADVEQQLYHTDPVPELPDEGVLEDASGQFAPARIDYRIADVQESAPEPSEPADDEPLIVPIDIHGPWRSFNEAQLREAHDKLRTQLPSIYSYRLGVDPDLRSESIDVDAEVDQARRTLANACALFEQERFLEAAELADSAMRIPTEEPIGVRMEALQLLATSALISGFFEESCEASRHRLNIAAACGLPLVQLEAATVLTEALMKLQSFAEAAEVAHTALSAVQGTQVGVQHGAAERTLRIRKLLVKALSELDLDTAAAQEALQIAEISESLHDKMDALEAAIHGFYYDHEFQRSFDTADAFIEVAHSYLLDAQAEAVVNPEAQSQLRDAAERVSEAFVNIVMERAQQPAWVDDATFDRLVELLDQRRDIRIKYLLSETMSEEFCWADGIEDKGIAALRCRRLDEGFRYLEDAASRFIAIGRPHLASRAWNSLARGKLMVGDVDAAKEYAERTLSVLCEPQWEDNEFRQDAKDILAAIADVQEEG